MRKAGRNITGVSKLFKNKLTGSLTLTFWRFRVTLDIVLLLLAPFTLWALAEAYVPIAGTSFSGWQSWGIAAVIFIFMFLSVFLHSLAHELSFRQKGTPIQIYLTPLGDPAQIRIPLQGAGREALNAAAGPLMQVLLGGLFYVVWNLQITNFISTVTAFLIFFNLGLAAVNLSPVFPFDGGRLMRAAAWKLLKRPGTATKLAERAGWGLCTGLVIWSIILLIPQERFHLETAGATFLIALLIALHLQFYKTRPWDKPEINARISKKSLVLRASAVTLLILPLAAVMLSLLPLNQGLEAPGFTASVEPMVRIPAEYRHTNTGKLLLLTVIPQAPIIVGEWVYAHIDSSIRLTPPEQIVPEDKSAQSVSEENYRMLLDSETTAIIAGLRLAGFSAEVQNAGVRIVAVLESSPARELLRAGDIITGIDSNPVSTPTDLTDYLKQLTEPSVLKLTIERAGETLILDVPTMEPEEPGGAVKIGIAIEPYSTGYTLPFPVEIVAEKVSGGPSAGLMFTLAVYDLLTGKNITGGRIIAGTGTIDLEGNVGAIGGVQQKVAAAERAGAVYFLCPEENYEDALAAATHIKVIKVKTAQEAIDVLQLAAGK